MRVHWRKLISFLWATLVVASGWPSQHWNCNWWSPVHGVCMLTQSLWVHMCISLAVFGRSWCLVSYNPSGSSLSTSSSTAVPESGGGNLMTTVSFGTEYSVVSPYLSLLWSTAGESFSAGGWARHWLMSIAEYHSIITFLKQNSSALFYPRLMASQKNFLNS